MLAAEREEVARLLEPSCIWPENWTAAQVFLCCHWEKQPLIVGDKLRTIFLGIASSEIIAVCLAKRVSRKEWDYVLWAVRAMAHAAVKVLNSEEE